MADDDLRHMRTDILDYMRERFDQVDERLDRINGTVRTHDSRLTTIETQCAERTCRLQPAAPAASVLRDAQAWKVGGLGAGLASAAWVVVEFIKTWLGLPPKP